MKINASQALKNLKGDAYQNAGKDLTLGEVVTEALATDQTPGKFKLYLLAKKFYEGGEIDLDAADLGLIKKAIEGCTSYNNLVLGAALEALEV